MVRTNLEGVEALAIACLALLEPTPCRIERKTVRVHIGPDQIEGRRSQSPRDRQRIAAVSIGQPYIVFPELIVRAVIASTIHQKIQLPIIRTIRRRPQSKLPVHDAGPGRRTGCHRIVMRAPVVEVRVTADTPCGNPGQDSLGVVVFVFVCGLKREAQAIDCAVWTADILATATEHALAW